MVQIFEVLRFQKALVLLIFSICVDENMLLCWFSQMGAFGENLRLS